MTARTDRSYAALLRLPSLGRVISSMILSRIAQSMVGVAMVLFTLREYGSPALAGAVTVAYVLPGLVVSPIAGALLDRHGRIRLVILDYCIAAAALALIGGLALGDALPPWLLIAIAAVASLTSILSTTGLRSLFPILVPKQLWERVNAVEFERLRLRDHPRTAHRRGSRGLRRRADHPLRHRRPAAARHDPALRGPRSGGRNDERWPPPR